MEPTLQTPVASFTESSEIVYTGELIAFNASASYDPDGVVVSYYWDFGDGTNATGVVVNHSYVDDGNYTVTLTVIDDDGAYDSVSSVKTVLNRSPVASFTESAETVLTGEVISFNASSSYDSDGVIVNYFWDFGDSTNATGVIVEHAYTEDGTYTVTLTITDDDGATSTATANKYAGNNPPVASFTESAETVYTGETISFDASDSYDSDGVIVEYFWDFGDGINATGMTVGHSYGDDGNYTVTLTVTDDDGAIGTASVVKTVLNQAPIAMFTQSKTTAYTNELVQFDASDSYDPDGVIVSYYWDFGDGANATGVLVEHAYTDDGVYTIILTLTDNDGATGTASGTTNVLNRSPVASFTESAETVYTNEIIIFNASSSYDFDGSIVEYYWDFGDGSNASGVTVMHSYGDEGNYTVTLTVTDDDDANDSASSVKSVLNRSPVPVFTESATTVFTGESISFNASSSYDSDGVVVSYYWDFGDGSNATGVVVSHAYVDDGNYTVVLTATDDDGATDTISAVKSVLNRSPVPVFTESATTVFTGEPVTFNASASYDPDGVIVEYFWDFGDGTNATGVVVEHSYADNSNYTISLVVTDNDGAVSSVASIKTVLNRPPIAVFTESADTVFIGQTISFNASDSYDVDGSIVEYFWDFGDGFNITGVVAEHTYEINGTYTVTLTVTDDDGATSSASSTKTILWNEPPIASFTESATTVFTGESITFNASASYDPDGSIVSFFWDFGDGTNGTGVIINHSYLDDGVYTVTLTVTDNRDAIGRASADKNVLNRLPVAIFTESAETVYTGTSISFDASLSYDSDGVIISYHWDFGDGSNATGVLVDHAYVDDGNYSVTLTVTDDDGAISSTSSTKIVLNRDPVASFTYSPEFPIAGEMVTFNASASYDLDGYIVNYTWNFGDGNITVSTSPVIIHAYAMEGNYTVTLTVIDDDDAASVTEGIVGMKNYPTARFVYSPTYPGEGQSVTFDASSSTPNGGFIANYSWSFGDGNETTVTEPIIVHVYAVTGNYTVTLNVTDSEGLSDSQSQTVEVGVPPVAFFIYSPSLPYIDETVMFNASASYDPDGYIASYTWDFGDGNLTATSDPIIYHAYSKGGDYMVELVVSDDKGVSSTASHILTVEGNPTANFTWTPNIPIVDDTVTFNASPSSPNGGIITDYLWNFGDGTQLNTTTPIATHIYGTYGNFTVILTVVDNYGLSGTDSKDVRIRDYPVANFTYSPSLARRMMPVTFNASMSDPRGGTIIDYLWDFKDGNITSTTNPITTHIFQAGGLYQVTLTVTDDENLSSSYSKIVMVINTSPFASFTHSPEKPIAGETVTFNASDSYDIDGIIINYLWEFSDGTNTTGKIIEHTFSNAGTYEVTLIVEDDVGATNSTSQNVEVIAYPSVFFVYSPYPAVVLEPTIFNASYSSPGSGLIVNYTWDFDDGNITTTTETTIIHIFNESRRYRVSLTIVNSDGLTDSLTKPVDLYGIPYASFTWTPTIPLASETVIFNASASEPNGGSIQSYTWDFGDGTPPVVEQDNATATHQFAAYGTYNVTLKVRNNAGLTGTVTKEITVLSPPQTEFIWTPEIPHTYDIVTFDASYSSPGSGSITNYTWNFGDGNTTTTTDPSITHYYTNEGDHTVTLNITNSDGLFNTKSKITSIIPAEPPIAEFTVSPLSPGVYEETTFNASDSLAQGGPIVNYEWNFGDGNNTGVSTAIIYHSYNTEGNYTITLNVTNTAGYWSITTKQIEVTPISNPTANFTWSPTLTYFNQTITFDASTSTPGWNGTTYPPLVQYTWNFGDGNVTITTEPIIDHVYYERGNYTVILTVMDADGRTANLNKTIAVAGLIGDLNGDGEVDMRDVAIVARAFGTEEGDPQWDPIADLTGPEHLVPDGIVDMRDVALVASHFGDTI